MREVEKMAPLMNLRTLYLYCEDAPDNNPGTVYADIVYYILLCYVKLYYEDDCVHTSCIYFVFGDLK